MCLAVGGVWREFGAFYINCFGGYMTGLEMRLVALAGPVVSLVLGLLAYAILERLPDANPNARYFTWLLGTVALLAAAGYPLFSGVTGLGDFGVSQAGVLFELMPEWLWRAVAAVGGGVAYMLFAIFAMRQMERLIGGSGEGRVARAQRLAVISYLTGAIVSVLIGLLNPNGLFITLASAAAASIGGTSALLWMMQMMDRKRETQQACFSMPPSTAWMVTGVVVTLVFALGLGPTLRLA